MLEINLLRVVGINGDARDTFTAYIYISKKSTHTIANSEKHTWYCLITGIP